MALEFLAVWSFWLRDLGIRNSFCSLSLSAVHLQKFWDLLVSFGQGPVRRMKVRMFMVQPSSLGFRVLGLEFGTLHQCISTYMHMETHKYTRIHIYIYIYIYICIFYAPVCIYIHIYIYIYIYIHIRTYIHTYIHSYIYMYMFERPGLGD